MTKGNLLKGMLVFAVAQAILASTASAGSQRARVDSLIEHEWPKGASGTVLVSRGGRAITCKGLGWADRAGRVPASCDTAYDIGSLTKQFTAAAILKLQMMGRLRVGESIDRFFGGVPPDKRAITISDLLDQTSGLIDSLGGDYEPLSRRRMVARAMRSRLLSKPGKAYHYSNVGYSLLATIVAKASGVSYERFLRRYLFRAAGMWHTGYVLPRWRPGQRPAGDPQRRQRLVLRGARASAGEADHGVLGQQPRK
jgi:CubicO group peptidase (beta-lactamase class C family)